MNKSEALMMVIKCSCKSSSSSPPSVAFVDLHSLKASRFEYGTWNSYGFVNNWLESSQRRRRREEGEKFEG